MSGDNKKLLAEILALSMSICDYTGMSFDDIFYLSDEKIMNYSMSLIFEIRDLIDNGHTYEEILELISNAKFEDGLNEDEIDFLKKDARKNLKLIYERKGDKNDKD